MCWAARVLHWHMQQVPVFPEMVREFLQICLGRDWWLQLFILNKELLVSVSHQLVLIMSLPFVHTARRSYWLSAPVNSLDIALLISDKSTMKFRWTLSLRGRRSRNKVSIGEPVEGSFAYLSQYHCELLSRSTMFSARRECSRNAQEGSCVDAQSVTHCFPWWCPLLGFKIFSIGCFSWGDDEGCSKVW